MRWLRNVTVGKDPAAGILLGIGMAVTPFVLLLIAAVPNLVQDADYAGTDARTDAELLEMFTAHPAYSAMYERFPDAVEALGSHGRGGSLRVGAMDFESGGRYGMTSVNARATGGGVGEGLIPYQGCVPRTYTIQNHKAY